MPVEYRIKKHQSQTFDAPLWRVSRANYDMFGGSCDIMGEYKSPQEATIAAMSVAELDKAIVVYQQAGRDSDRTVCIANYTPKKPTKVTIQIDRNIAEWLNATKDFYRKSTDMKQLDNLTQLSRAASDALKAEHDMETKVRSHTNNC